MSETLHGFYLRDNELVIAVTSNGCTTAESFRLDAVSGITGWMLTVERITPDDCRMVPHTREFTLPLPRELRGQPFTVQNRFADGPRGMGLGVAGNPD